MAATATTAATAAGTYPEHLLKPEIFAWPDAVVRRDPFPFTVVKGALPDAARATIGGDFPRYERSGFFPYLPEECGPSVQRLVDDIRRPEFADALGNALGVERLSQYPTIVTIRKLSKETDGRIHNDSKSKIVTALLYLNDTWPDTSGGCFRFLSSPESFDHQVGDEVKPLYGTFTAFRRTENSWHGHLPYTGERRVIQIAWLTSQDELDRKLKRGRFTRFVKQLLTRA
jgi:hypothetical protein